MGFRDWKKKNSPVSSLFLLKRRLDTLLFLKKDSKAIWKTWTSSQAGYFSTILLNPDVYFWDPIYLCIMPVEPQGNSRVKKHSYVEKNV